MMLLLTDGSCEGWIWGDVAGKPILSHPRFQSSKVFELIQVNRSLGVGGHVLDVPFFNNAVHVFEAPHVL